MIPGIRDDLARPIQITRKPSRAPAYITVVGDDLNASRINGEVDGMEAYRQAVWHIVHTERFDYAMNLPNEGIEFRQFIGESFAFFCARIDRVLSDAIFQDDRTLAVKVLRKWQPGPRHAACTVELQCVYGTLVENFEIPLAA